MKKLIALALTAVFAVSLVGCGTTAESSSNTDIKVETTEPVTTEIPTTVQETTKAEYDLAIENTLKDIKYCTPSQFETKGTSGLIFNHQSPENDNLLVSYTELSDDILLYTESQANELLDSIVEGMKGDRDFELSSKKYLEIASCYGIEFSYKMEGVYAHTYAFLWNDGAYNFSYSSTEPISEEDETLLSAIIDSIVLQ